ncbi:MAG: polysaccharide biosynthesis C-terminal domain-containing protein [Lachnospiraceae bacterium]|nr:polysaccharide biosynthesis C-terminal domain-containing protein [Lachnospiraceae bacterium]
MRSKYKTLVSNTVIFAVGSILVKLISFILMPLYTSVLTTEQYGIAELLNNMIEIVLPLATLCIVEALYRFSIDEDSDRSELLTDSFVIIILGDILVGTVCSVLYFAFGYKYSFHFLLLFATTSLYRVSSEFARGIGHVKRYASYGVINALLLVISNIVLLLWLGGGISAYLLSFSIGYGVTAVVSFFASQEYRFLSADRFNTVRLKEMLRYSLPGIPNMLSWWINSASDRYIMLLFWGAGSAGLYTAAGKLPAIINLVTSIFQQAWQYSAATQIDSPDRKSFFSNVFRGYAYTCALACGGLLIANKFICRILLKSDFYPAWKYVPFLLLAATIGCIATYFGTFYNAVKNNKMLMISTLTGAACNILMNLILIPLFGGFGAAIATTVSYYLITVIRMVDINRMIDLDINYKRLILQFILVVLSAVSSCFEGTSSIVIPICCFSLIILSDHKLLKQGFDILNGRLATGKENR